MTGREMRIAFERLVQQANPEYILNEKLDTDTITYFLNAAQERFVKSNYLALTNKEIMDEQTSKIYEALRNLIRKVSTSNEIERSSTSGTPTIADLGYFFNVNNDDKFFLYLSSACRVSGTYKNIPEDAKKQFFEYPLVPCKEATIEELNKIKTSYFNKPIIRIPLVRFLDSNAGKNNRFTVEIYHDEYTKIQWFEMEYVKQPRLLGEINDYCELGENVHQEIVELAVEIFITESAYRLQGGEKPWRRTPQNPEGGNS